MWACTSCNKRMSRKLTVCPKCGGQGGYICAKCHKPLPDGKYNYCGAHLLERAEKRKETREKVGAAALTVGVTVVGGLKVALNHSDQIKDAVTTVAKIGKDILKG